MSTKFSRRDFMKYTAVAALAVASSSLFTGCSDPNKPTMSGVGGITLLNVSTQLKEYNINEPSFKFVITNGRTNEIDVLPTNFVVDVYKTVDGKEVLQREYDAYNGVELSNRKQGLTNNTAFETTLTVKNFVQLGDGEFFKVKYWPDRTYTEMWGTWTDLK